MQDGDFEKFLADVSKEDAARKTWDDSMAQANALLRESDIPHIYDEDREIRLQQMENYTAKRVTHYLLHPDELPGRVEPTEEFIKKYAFEDAKDKCMEEKIFLGHVALSICAQQYGSTHEHLTRGKKAFLADQMAHGMNLNDPMMRFFSEAAPGDTLDPASEADQQYMVDALLKLQESEEHSKKFDEVVYDIWAVLRRWTTKNPEDMHDVACDLALACVYGRYPKMFGDSATYKRENHVAEVCRKHEISQILGNEGDQSIIQAIVSAIDNHYPIPAVSDDKE